VDKNRKSQFAPAQREDFSTIRSQKKLLADYLGSVGKLYDAISEMIFIVNRERQVVFFNSAVPSVLGLDDPEEIYGLRPGEALDCVYADENPGGCGTSVYCSQCGVVDAILSSLDNKPGLRECRVLKKNNLEALVFLVRTTPFKIKGQLFSIIAITDISHEKKREALEHIFFHDIMNTVSSVNLFAEIINSNNESLKDNEKWKNLLAGFRQIMDMLRSQVEWMAAEKNELEPKMENVDVGSILEEVVQTLNNRFINHKILVKKSKKSFSLDTDPSLLRRVLENMILNALEASRHEETVTVSCQAAGGHAEFCVHNSCYMPKELQLQLFQRSFSTKGSGRGLGTYSMKLISERYLNGTISFSSSPGKGTTFVARYPLVSD